VNGLRIRAGDVLVGVAGVDVRNMKFGQIMTLMKSIGVGEACHVKFCRVQDGLKGYIDDRKQVQVSELTFFETLP
jgi:hypothetical protein